MEILSSYNLIIEASAIIILSFIFGEISNKTNIPSVLMLILLGIGLNLFVENFLMLKYNYFPVLEILGIIGLIMIVLEAALELELRQKNMMPILKTLFLATAGLSLSAWATAEILQYFIQGMDRITAWIYATPLSILSSAIIIPSVSGLVGTKKEFHVYESTFSDILGIMLFYFLVGQVESSEHSENVWMFVGNFGLTIAISLIAGYSLLFIFQKIKSNIKLFLLISILLILYSIGKKMHLSSLIIILIFGLMIANMPLFFKGILKKWIDLKKAREMYDGLHVVTRESAFVVRTFFFVIFGMTIALSSLLDLNVALVSILIIFSIYGIRFLLLRIFVGADIVPQVFIAPRGLITVLLFYAIPKDVQLIGFNAGILLFIIIATSLIMTLALIFDKQRSLKAIRKTESKPVGYQKWKAPDVDKYIKNSTAPEQKS
ncbi:MAG: cation:proton antiporter [Prolixibacteraceae bacterium]|jgi:NhaP-type Na+/H+ or K+/H+ antiporter